MLVWNLKAIASITARWSRQRPPLAGSAPGATARSAPTVHQSTAHPDQRPTDLTKPPGRGRGRLSPLSVEGAPLWEFDAGRLRLLSVVGATTGRRCRRTFPSGVVNVSCGCRDLPEPWLVVGRLS